MMCRQHCSMTLQSYIFFRLVMLLPGPFYHNGPSLMEGFLIIDGNKKMYGCFPTTIHFKP